MSNLDVGWNIAFVKQCVAHPATIFMVFTLVYCITMPIVLQWNGDAIVEVNLAEAADPPARPNHLLLTPTYSVLAANNAVAPNFVKYQLLNVGAGSAAVAMFMLVLMRVGAGTLAAVLVPSLMATTYVHWLHSREVESSILAQFFLIAALYTMVRFRSITGGFLTGVLLGTANLYALNYASLAPAFLAGVVLIGGTTQRAAKATAFIAAVGIVTMLPLVIVGAMQESDGGAREFVSWVLHHGSSDRLAESGRLSINGCLRAASGAVNVYVGNTGVATMAKLALKGGGEVQVPVADWLRFAFGGVIAGICVMFGLIALRNGSSVGIVSLIAVAISFIVNSVWLGSDPQFWLPALPFLLFGLALSDLWSRRARTMSLGVAVIIAGMLLTNWTYPVPTLWERDGGIEYRQVEHFEDLAKDADLLIYTESWGRCFGIQSNDGTEVLSFSYSFNTSANRYLPQVVAMVERAWERNGAVYIQGLLGPQEQFTVGVWEEIETATGVSRQTVIQSLAEISTAELVSEPVFGGKLWLLNRKEALGARRAEGAGR